MTRRIISFIIPVSALLISAGCRRLDGIPYSPPVTPGAYLQAQHWIRVTLGAHSFILIQPSSTVIVYFVGLFTIYTGYRFLRERGQQRARLLWGAGLILTGVGAMCAGTSYQALGYEIRCAGRSCCTYTSWWEVLYMLLSVPGLNALLSASAYTSATGRFRRAIITYAIGHSIAYVSLLLYGALMPVRELVSFDLFVLVSAPGVALLLWLHMTAYGAGRTTSALRLRNTWLIFTAVSAAYLVYQQAGLTQLLWQRGIWLSENDVLHTGMIIWVYYILTRLRLHIYDLPDDRTS